MNEFQRKWKIPFYQLTLSTADIFLCLSKVSFLVASWSCFRCSRSNWLLTIAKAWLRLLLLKLPCEDMEAIELTLELRVEAELAETAAILARLAFLPVLVSTDIEFTISHSVKEKNKGKLCFTIFRALFMMMVIIAPFFEIMIWLITNNFGKMVKIIIAKEAL